MAEVGAGGGMPASPEAGVDLPVRNRVKDLGFWGQSRVWGLESMGQSGCGVKSPWISQGVGLRVHGSVRVWG